MWLPSVVLATPGSCWKLSDPVRSAMILLKSWHVPADAPEAEASLSMTVWSLLRKEVAVSTASTVPHR